jgi:hypothetical protein
MKNVSLSVREKGIANYMIEQNKAALNRIGRDCVAPLVSVRQTLSECAKEIGVTRLVSEAPLSRQEWINITLWIFQGFYK